MYMYGYCYTQLTNVLGNILVKKIGFGLWLPIGLSLDLVIGIFVEQG